MKGGTNIKELFLSFNTYNLRTRISATIIFFGPCLFELYLFFPEIREFPTTIIIILITYSLCNLFIIFWRIPGVKAMKKCFPEMLPAQMFLLPSSEYIHTSTKKRYYKFLSKKIDEFKICESDEEMKPCICTAVTWLIAQTRNEKEFPLIYEENINFGFSYNLLGMKNYAIVLILSLLIIDAILLNLKINSKFNLTIPFEVIITAMAFCFFFLLIWIFIINKNLVFSCGRKYARALLAACDSPILNDSSK